MPKTTYQYGTSPRKYETEYTTRKNTLKKVVEKENVEKKRKKAIIKEKSRKIQERKIKAGQVVLVFTIFGMLLTVSYREISIMEMFNQKKELENQLATIQKENGQIEKSITEVESSLDWNSIQQKATDELGMQKKAGIPVSLEKSDNVETKQQFIKDEKVSLFEKIVCFFIDKF